MSNTADAIFSSRARVLELEAETALVREKNNAEIDRLRACNAELVAALELAWASLDYAVNALQPPENSQMMDTFRTVRAALAKAREPVGG